MAVAMRAVMKKPPPAIVAADHAIPPYSWIQKCPTMPIRPMTAHAVRHVIRFASRHVHSERQRADNIDGAENREGDPTQRHQVDDEDQPRVIEKSGHGLWPTNPVRMQARTSATWAVPR